MRYRDRRERIKTPTPVAELVDRVLSGYHIAEDVRQRRIVTEWSNIVGHRLANRTQPGRVQEGVLDVRVCNSSWLHQISFLADEIVARINNTVGEPQMVSDIRWVLGKPRIERPPTGRIGRANSHGEVVHPRAAPPAHEQAIREESKSVEDDELRQLIRDVRTRYDL